LGSVAYFCMEYGLHEELPIYAGGLGILAGDYLKEAKEEQAPVVGIGILWRQDYTKQLIGEGGWPKDYYPVYDYDFVKDTGIRVKVRIRGMEVICKVHLVDQYDNAPLYLLDAGFPDSEHGWMTAKLYGGSAQDRIAQEIILGIGGVKALRALNIPVDCYHFNEGHAALAGLELIRQKMQAGLSFDEAWGKTRREVVFTTHTPVVAGNEEHPLGLLYHMEANNGLSYEEMRRIGGDPFNMTVAALRLSSKANAVSQLHQKTARKMWQGVEGAAPIIAITNGVHQATWQDQRIREVWEGGGDLWGAHQLLKKELLDFIRKETGYQLSKDILTIGFARRAAAYKRSELIFRDLDSIKYLLKKRKLQLVFSGKAHPDDYEGKKIIQELVRMDQSYGEAVVFLENYDMETARYLVRGSDVWLNNPRRPLEASGTSGMKAAMNGVLNVSVVDGWVAEGPEHGISGWLLDEVLEEELPHEDQDAYDLRALFQVLNSEIIPIYYFDRSRWVGMMRASIEMAQSKFTTRRMFRQYWQQMYTKERE
jgi:starch phosphorylase